MFLVCLTYQWSSTCSIKLHQLPVPLSHIDVPCAHDPLDMAKQMFGTCICSYFCIDGWLPSTCFLKSGRAPCHVVPDAIPMGLKCLLTERQHSASEPQLQSVKPPFHM